VFPDGLVDLVEAAAGATSSIRYVEARRRGYVVCDVTPGSLTAAFRYVGSTASPTAPIETGARWVVRAGDPEPRPA
jgi:phosphodiesterase/alkaline phosphatase D-like protein